MQWTVLRGNSHLVDQDSLPVGPQRIPDGQGSVEQRGAVISSYRWEIIKGEVTVSLDPRILSRAPSSFFVGEWEALWLRPTLCLLSVVVSFYPDALPLLSLLNIQLLPNRPPSLQPHCCHDSNTGPASSRCQPEVSGGVLRAEQAHTLLLCLESGTRRAWEGGLMDNCPPLPFLSMPSPEIYIQLHGVLSYMRFLVPV